MIATTAVDLEIFSGMTLTDVFPSGLAAAKVKRLVKAHKCTWCAGRSEEEGGECGRPPVPGKMGCSGPCYYRFWMEVQRTPVARRESLKKKYILEGRLLTPNPGRPAGSKAKT